MKVLPNVYQIDAFTDEPFHGNSAGVVYSDDLTEKEMQYIAREMNVSETAFISNQYEERLLKTKRMQQRIAKAIYEGIKKFKEK